MTAESSSAKYIVSRGICGKHYGKHCDKFCFFTLAELFKLGGVAELLLNLLPRMLSPHLRDRICVQV